MSESERTFHKSSYSNDGGCVEVAEGSEAVAVRDSKDQGGPVFTFGTQAWTQFVREVSAGTFDI